MRKASTFGALALVAVLLLPDSSFAQRFRIFRGRSSGGSYNVRYVPVYTYPTYRYIVPTYYEVVREPVSVSPGIPATVSRSESPPTVTEPAPPSESLPPPKEVPRPAESVSPEKEPPAPTAENAATVNLLLPTAEAEVWVEGRKVEGQGTARRFVSPSLGAGERFTFNFRARWIGAGGEMTETRKVDVYAGDRVTVDFKNAARPAQEIVPREYKEPRP